MTACIAARRVGTFGRFRLENTMRAALLALSATLALAMPAGAQTLSPMTGTTASPPSAAATAPATGAAPAASPAGAAQAPAAHAGRRTMAQRFAAANTTGDGKLTLEQAKAGRMNRVVRNFDAIDREKHGYVTLADIRAYDCSQRALRKVAPKPTAQ